MGRKHQTYPDKDTSREKDEALKKKDQKIKELEKEVRHLKGELKTLNKALDKFAAYTKHNLDGISLEKVIAGAKQEKTMVEIKKQNACPTCGEELRDSKLPFGRLEICSAGCGYRKVENDV